MPSKSYFFQGKSYFCLLSELRKEYYLYHKFKINIVLGGILVIIPTYNEKENVRKITSAIRSLPMHLDILFVDDGSPDGTGRIIREMMETDHHIHLIERSGKLGLGTAYIVGFKFGIQHGYDFICEMDADFSHQPKDLIRLIKACDNNYFDLSVGSRYVKGGGIQNWPSDRLFLSYGASLYVRVITWMNVKDPTAGFVCYKRQVLETIDLDKIKFVGYAFQIEMKFAAKSLGFRLKEIPIVFTDRVEGVSKMNKSIISEAIFGVIKMKWNSFWNSYRIKRLHNA
ncbi:MAG TPA: polyprenol monophosphomannose synthase [Saprospiraceae bacterium]|nr:polyprenol monophosphomannose synthase [Saprospiraceae bacterium]